MQCKEKVRYLSQQSAYMAAARIIGKIDYIQLRAYKCPHCYGWHLTRNKD